MASFYPSGMRLVLDSVVSPAELNNLTATVAAAPCAPDECRHCGAPSPGARCRFCSTATASLDFAPGHPVFA